jgi:alkylation response protein AidB-like acyl-CoA dehydrogenase
MNFAFTPDQDEFRRMLRSFFERRSPESEVRRLMETDAGYDAELWQKMSRELGLQGLIVPEEYGGSGFSYVELCLVLEEMGRHLVCAPLFSTVVLAANTLLRADDSAASQSILPGVAAGDTIATLAFIDDDEGPPGSVGATTATRSGDTWRLTGAKTFVLDGHIATLILVTARTSAGLSIFAVDGEDAAVSRGLLNTMDQTRKQARVEFSSTPARLVGSDGSGEKVLADVLDLAAIALAAEQVGGGQRVLDTAVQYAKDRVQFGRPIGSFQAIKHKCADLLFQVETAKSVAYYAAECAAAGSPEVSQVAALAKAYCSDMYVSATAENIQIHGGIGFTWEHSAHLYFRRAKSSELLLGHPSRWRDTFVERFAHDAGSAVAS